MLIVNIQIWNTLEKCTALSQRHCALDLKFLFKGLSILGDNCFNVFIYFFSNVMAILKYIQMSLEKMKIQKIFTVKDMCTHLTTVAILHDIPGKGKHFIISLPLCDIVDDNTTFSL